MLNKIINVFLTIFSGITSTLYGKYLLIFIISLLPILELRGGLIAAALLDVDIVPASLICLLSNALIIPFVLFLVEKMLQILSMINFLKKIIDAIKKRTLTKKELVEKYGYFGIFMFVAVPLPGSGAWTGCLIAVLLGMNKKKSFVSALLGVFVAEIIMLIFSYGILKNI